MQLSILLVISGLIRYILRFIITKPQAFKYNIGFLGEGVGVSLCLVNDPAIEGCFRGLGPVNALSSSNSSNSVTWDSTAAAATAAAAAASAAKSAASSAALRFWAVSLASSSSLALLRWDSEGV